MVTPEMLARLPRWAQEEIRVLTMRLAEERENALKISTGQTRVRMRTWEGPDLVLPELPIEFLLGERFTVTARLEEGPGGMARLNLNGSASEGLAVLLRSGNVVLIERGSP